MAITRIPYTEEQQRRDAEHRKDTHWFNRHNMELMQQYPEQWIAVHGQKVVGAAPELCDLMAQLKEKGIAEEVIFLEYMTKDEIRMMDVYDPDTGEWQSVVMTFRWRDDFGRI